MKFKNRGSLLLLAFVLAGCSTAASSSTAGRVNFLRLNPGEQDFIERFDTTKLPELFKKDISELLDEEDPEEEGNQEAQEEQEEQVRKSQQKSSSDLKVTSPDDSRYYYSQMDEDDQYVYQTIFESVDQRKKMNFEKKPTEDDYLDIFQRFLLDYPEYSNYYLWTTTYYMDMEDSARVQTIQPEFNVDYDDWQTMYRQADEQAEAIADQTKGLEPVEAEKYIHDWLISNIQYSCEVKNCYNIIGALVNGQAACSGYSAAFEFVCRKAGIRAPQIYGALWRQDEERWTSNTQEDPGHAWNMVELDGGWYFTDSCWDDWEGTLELEGMYTYFNLPYDQMYISRKNDDYIDDLIPDKSNTKQSYWKLNDIKADSLEEAEKCVLRQLKELNGKPGIIEVFTDSKEVMEQVQKINGFVLWENSEKERAPFSDWYIVSTYSEESEFESAPYGVYFKTGQDSESDQDQSS